MSKKDKLRSTFVTWHWPHQQAASQEIKEDMSKWNPTKHMPNETNILKTGLSQNTVCDLTWRHVGPRARRHEQKSVHSILERVQV